MGGLGAEQFDELLATGYRRSGVFVYQTRCPGCQQCRPTRVLVDQFRWGRSFKRVLARANAELTCVWGPPQVDSRRVDLFNRHRTGRGLTGEDSEPAGAAAYRSFLAESCCQTAELSVWRGDELMAVSIMDVGAMSISMVYTSFEPGAHAARLSLGTLAVLRQILWAAEHRRRYAYLGFYVADNPHLNYKSRFTPQQRYDGEHWHDVTA